MAFPGSGKQIFQAGDSGTTLRSSLVPSPGECISIGPDRAYAPSMRSQSALPLFHLHGDPPDDQAFDFIHVETIGARAALHDWTILAHRHRSLFQILLIERGGGEMVHETAIRPFEAPAAILVAPTVAHGFRFRPRETDGWVVSFTQGLARALGEQSGAALARFKALASDPVVPLGSGTDTRRLSALCSDLSEEHVLAREGHGLAMRGLLALIAIEVVRLAARRAHSGTPALAPADATVGALRHLIEQHFRREHHVGFYAQRLAMTASRLNDHLKRAAGVTAGHLIRQRLLIEAKHQLVFTNQAIHEIASELAFPDPSHFTRFFRNNTGTTPQEFRAARGG